MKLHNEPGECDHRVVTRGTHRVLGERHMRTSSRFRPGFAALHTMTRVVVGASLGLVSSVASASPVPWTETGTLATLDPLNIGDQQTGEVCGGGWVRSHAHAHVTETGHVKAFAAPAGFGATDLQHAYNIPAITTRPVIAIVDAYGYPNLETDLAQYRTTMGLPACASADGCLQIVNQQGAKSPLPAAPPANDDWTIETALDVDMASAACPSCKIIVVQANDDQTTGLFTANNVPSTLGATVVSNSWGGVEQVGTTASLEVNFNHPGVTVFA